MSMIPQHPNVVRYFGAVLTKPNYALVLEFCGIPPVWDGGLTIHSLRQLLSEPKAALTWQESCSIAAGIATGMAHIHSARVGCASAKRPWPERRAFLFLLFVFAEPDWCRRLPLRRDAAA